MYMYYSVVQPSIQGCVAILIVLGKETLKLTTPRPCLPAAYVAVKGIRNSFIFIHNTTTALWEKEVCLFTRYIRGTALNKRSAKNA
jgi:hypothetical protein